MKITLLSNISLPMQPRVFLFLVILLFTACKDEKSKIKSNGETLVSQAMVSSAHPLATEAGLKILQSGGNAFDAAVALAATLNVVEPMNSGMGGYGTILIYHAKTKKIRFLDSSGRIPLAMDSDLMRPPTENYRENRRGAKSISTPGNVNAWHAMSKEYGAKEWATLFDPAIKLAEHGFPVSRQLERMLSYSFDQFPGHVKAFYGRNGKALKADDSLVQKDLANSLRMVAEQGRAVFYEGTLAQKIDRAMKASGSFLSIKDLQEDKAEWWDPIKINYKGYQVYTASAPANAFPFLIRLGLMSRFEDRSLEHNSVEYLHLFAEVTKHGFWTRLRYAGDPEISPPPLDRLLSDDYWNEMVAKINPSKASTFIPPDYIAMESKNTTHFVVADQAGNIVSATQTLGNLFGSKIMPEGTGIWLNNSLAYCTYEPKGNPMDAIPGQRKLSGDCPAIIFKDDLPWAALGTPGGHTIGQTVPQIIMNMIDFDMDIGQAIAAPRISFIEPNFLAVETGIKKSVIRFLEDLGHTIKKGATLGNAHGLSFHYDDTGRFIGYRGAADRRGKGMAMGY